MEASLPNEQVLVLGGFVALKDPQDVKTIPLGSCFPEARSVLLLSSDRIWENTDFSLMLIYGRIAPCIK